jgi:dTDP-4-dehydrorhamnose 3,5-epimerase-like enzyme
MCQRQLALPARSRNNAVPPHRALPGVKLIRRVRFGDVCGCFTEVFREDVLAAHGIEMRFVQKDHSLPAAPGVIHGSISR